MNNRLLKMSLLFVLIPLLILAIISAAYLLMVVRQDTLNSIDKQNRLYELFLINEARNAITLGDNEYFQSFIDQLINEHSNHLVSIELIDKNRTILASAPPLPDLAAAAVRIPITSSVSSDLDRFDFDMDGTASEREKKLVGYLLIRYNNNAVEYAVSRLVTHLGILLFIIIILLAVSYHLIKSRLIRPFSKLTEQITDLSNGQMTVTEVSPHYLSECQRSINTLSKKFRAKDDIIENLNSQLINTQSNVDFANLTKIEMMTELVNKLDRPVTTANELMLQIGKMNKDDNLINPVKYIAGCIDNIQRILNDTKIILDKTNIFVSYEQVRIKDFKEKLIQFISEPSVNLVKGFMCDEAYVNHYVEIDDTHYYQLISKLITFANSINNSDTLFLNIRIEKTGPHNASINIEIKDSGKVLSREDIQKINAYIHDDIKNIELASINHEALRVVKYLISACNASFIMSAEYNRGHHFLLAMDTKLLTSKTQDLGGKTPPTTITGYCFHDGSPDMSIKNHLKHVGIDIRCSAINDEDKIKAVIEGMKGNEFALVDFTGGNAEKALRSTFSIKDKNEDSLIIAFVNITQNSDAEFIERIFKAGVSKVITKPYTAATLIEILKTNTKSDKQLITKLLTQFTQPQND